MNFVLTLACVFLLFNIGETCLLFLRPGEDVCTDRGLCQTFAPCDLRPCPAEDNQSVCSNLADGRCLKRWRNMCEFQVAKCKNADIQMTPCPGPSLGCPEVAEGEKNSKCYLFAPIPISQHQ